MAKIKLPGIGPVEAKWVLAGAALVAGIAGFAWWRHLNAPPVEEEAATVDYTTGGDYVYGAGDPGLAFATDYAYDGGAYPYPSFTTPSYGVTSTVQTAMPVTNSEWTQRSIEHLELVGIDSREASLSVSRYLLKECLTAVQADIVRQAVAAIGTPPQGTYSIIVCPAGGTTPAPKEPGAAPSGTSLPAPTGLRILRTFRTEVQIAWSPVAGARGYAVFRSQPGAAVATWQRQTTSVYNSFQFKGLRPGTSYKFRIQSIGADNKAGGNAYITAKTKK